MTGSSKDSAECRMRIPRARNGASRGLCIRPRQHSGPCGNNTCPGCGVKKNENNSSPFLLKVKGNCRKCHAEYQRSYHEIPFMNYQQPGIKHIFPCGCSGVLPNCLGDSNQFVVAGQRGWKCRVTYILASSLGGSRRGSYTPINPLTPHLAIREMMKQKNCILCGAPLNWKPLEKERMPHLHHDHVTGEIFGFTHPHCNPRALEREIDRLKKIIKRYKKIFRKENVRPTN
jgi:hypothetical protein